MDPRRFGKGRVFRAEIEAVRTSALTNDLRLFAVTFAAGFLFVSVLIG